MLEVDEDCGKKMNLNESERQKLRKQNSWQYAKHVLMQNYILILSNPGRNTACLWIYSRRNAHFPVYGTSLKENREGGGRGRERGCKKGKHAGLQTDGDIDPKKRTEKATDRLVTKQPRPAKTGRLGQQSKQLHPSCDG